MLFQKEIHEQPESLTTTMRGRLIHGGSKVKGVLLGGLKDHLKTIRRSRRILFIGCGTSYYAGLATRALVEELSGENVDFSWMEAIECIFNFFVSWSF
jgi:glucosamine--fructose-6-phosphate aminotransferase (isomerizing)